MRASRVGLEILYPLRCRIGSTAPSVIGSRNLLECHAVANGPVSASPSPTTHATTRFGLSNTAPKEWLSEYPSSPPSWIDPGHSGDAWLGIPPGNENCKKSFRSPASSWLILGYISLYVPSRYVLLTTAGPPCPGPET